MKSAPSKAPTSFVSDAPQAGRTTAPRRGGVGVGTSPPPRTAPSCRPVASPLTLARPAVSRLFRGGPGAQAAARAHPVFFTGRRDVPLARGGGTCQGQST